jgi:hypothetical protein
MGAGPRSGDGCSFGAAALARSVIFLHGEMIADFLASSKLIEKAVDFQ